ncbi:hypothetical protein ABZ330_34715 [Streptomyces sp. NPDC006172]|uniref:hypothetical protein n=1 Tax=Streptomyces sp. NPDC006172 TaxID=3154470 RepID=UPI0033EF6CE0
MEDRRPFDIRLDHERAGPAVNEYARVCMAKLRSHAADALAPDDLAAMDALLDEAEPRGLAHRDDFVVRATRTAWIARRP